MIRKWGEMNVYENTTSIAIDLVDAYHPVRLLTEGAKNGFTFDAGSTGVAASVADAGSGRITITDTAHGLLVGEIVCFVNSTDYDGAYTVYSKTDDTFTVTKAYNADRTFNWFQPSTLKADAGSGGVYRINWSLTADSDANGKAFKFEPVVQLTAIDHAAAAKLWGNATDYDSLSGCGIATVKAGEYVWLQMKNITDATDITMYHANLNLVRI